MMSIRNLAGALVEVQMMVRNAANMLVPVLVEARDPAGDPTPTQPPAPTFTVSISPSAVTGAVSKSNGANAVTNEATASTTGGVAPFGFAWVSQDGAMTAIAPSAAVTRFSAFIVGGDSAEDTFICTVTDASGATASATVAASVFNYGTAL